MPPPSALISLGTQHLCCHGQPGLSKMLNTPQALPDSPGIQISPQCSPGMVAEAAGKSLSAPRPSMQVGLGVAFEGHVPGVPVSLTGSASHSCGESLWAEAKLESVFQAVMGLQAAGPDSPSSEGNNLETHLLGTSGTQCQQFTLQSCSVSYCQCGCSLCERVY